MVRGGGKPLPQAQVQPAQGAHAPPHAQLHQQVHIQQQARCASTNPQAAGLPPQQQALRPAPTIMACRCSGVTRTTSPKSR